MEFAHVGAHCNAAGCGQQDFLPFQCPGCRLPMCKEHRAPEAHACKRTAASGPRDAISIECPLCLKSIKMDRQEDPNAAFELHLSSTCTQAASTTARPSPACCPAPGCGVRLGPSNAFQCGRCNSCVCMSHRMPEDHGCASLRRERNARAAFVASARAGASDSGKKQQKPETTIANSSKSLSKTPSTTIAPKVTGGGSAISSSNQGGGGSGFQCPICDIPLASAEAVTRHVEAMHLSSAGSTVAPYPAPSSTPFGAPAAAPEVCPHCRATFSNVVELLSHVETAHTSAYAQGSSSSSSGTTYGSGGSSAGDEWGCRLT